LARRYGAVVELLDVRAHGEASALECLVGLGEGQSLHRWDADLDLAYMEHEVHRRIGLGGLSLGRRLVYDRAGFNGVILDVCDLAQLQPVGLQAPLGLAERDALDHRDLHHRVGGAGRECSSRQHTDQHKSDDGHRDHDGRAPRRTSWLLRDGGPRGWRGLNAWLGGGRDAPGGDLQLAVAGGHRSGHDLAGGGSGLQDAGGPLLRREDPGPVEILAAMELREIGEHLLGGSVPLGHFPRHRLVHDELGGGRDGRVQ